MKSSKPAIGRPSEALRRDKKSGTSFKEIRLIYVLPVLIATGALVFMKLNQRELLVENRVDEVSKPGNTHKSYRLHNYSFSQPLLLWENEVESPELRVVKRRVNFLLNNLATQHVITSASVYVNRLSRDQWFAINSDQTFMPASLLKLPYLMIYLKKSETDPNLLDKKITMTEKPGFIPGQTYTSKSIEIGKPYSVRELLSYMILYSDNNATYVLNKNIDYKSFQELFMDIGIERPDLAWKEFAMTVFDYSKFFQVLYGATYLNHENSEYALTLLSKCEFKEGMVSGVPEGVTVAHKFGESGKPTKGGLREFHESGIIYLPDDPIVVTIFTQGSEVRQLPGAIAQITKEIIDAVLELKNKPAKGSSTP